MKTKFKKRPETTKIVVHCSATREDKDFGVRDIRLWHKAKGWLDVGYHYVIKRDGTIEEGRPDDVIGAGAEGHNTDSIHICLVGGLDKEGKTLEGFHNAFTDAQEVSLFHLIAAMEEKYHTVRVVCGHRDLPRVDKACPCFDVIKWLEEVVV